jgi:hypothetical protein
MALLLIVDWSLEIPSYHTGAAPFQYNVRRRCAQTVTGPMPSSCIDGQLATERLFYEQPQGFIAVAHAASIGVFHIPIGSAIT